MGNGGTSVKTPFVLTPAGSCRYKARLFRNWMLGPVHWNPDRVAKRQARSQEKNKKTQQIKQKARLFRAQLPRENDFYDYAPPNADKIEKA